MSQLCLYLLGTPRVERDNIVITIDTRKAVALLAYLALTDHPGDREWLAALFWPESPTDKARASLRRALYLLRQTLGRQWLQATRTTVALRPAAGHTLWVDALHFRQLLNMDGIPFEVTQQSTGAADNLAALMQAMALYQGDFLQGLTLSDAPAFDEWQREQSAFLRRDALPAVEVLTRAYAARQEWKTAIVFALRWLALDPYQEVAHRLLMSLYMQSGERTAALHQYQICTRLLHSELQTEPEVETTLLYQRIRDGHTQAANKQDGTAPAVWPRHHLPVPPTPFIGREKELAHVAALLAKPDCRLLSILGLGGIGKTRLALAAAGAQLDNFRDGVYFVDLTAVTAPSFLPAAIANALDLSRPGAEGPQRQLNDYLRQKHILLLLDNFEHVVAGGEFLVDLLANAPGLKLLVTSRQRLHLQEEWVFQVGGLRGGEEDGPKTGMPTLTNEAVQLFINTGQRLQPDFTWAAAEMPTVARICQLLAGMPLGIELAAVWVAVLPLTEILAELERSYRFLATNLRNVTSRHRSLEAVFDYSWNLLTPAEQDVLCRLSVFRGGFTREAAVAVAGADAFTLLALVDKSLVQPLPTRRYAMHEALRQFGAEKLALLPDHQQLIRDRHCFYYAAFLQGQNWQSAPAHRQKTPTLVKVQSEIDNCLLAWHWAVTRGKLAQIAQALDGLFYYFEKKALCREGWALFGDAASLLENEWAVHGVKTAPASLLLARIRSRQGRFAYHVSAYDEAKKLLNSSLPVFRRHQLQPELAFLFDTLGDIAYQTGWYEEAQQHRSDALLLYQQQQDDFGVVNALACLGDARFRLGHYTAAQQHYQESLLISERIGDPYGCAQALNGLGILARVSGEYAAAKDLFERCLVLERELDDPHGIARTLLNLGATAWSLGEIDAAEKLYQESLIVNETIGNPLRMIICLSSLGEFAWERGDLTRARELYAQCLALNASVCSHYQASIVHNQLGRLAFTEGQHQQAYGYFQKALHSALEIHSVPLALNVMTGIGMVWYQRGKVSAALELWAFALSHPANDQPQREVAMRLLSELDIHIPSQMTAVAEQMVSAMSFEAMVKHILGESIEVYDSPHP